jgi:hypothetical protein
MRNLIVIPAERSESRNPVTFSVRNCIPVVTGFRVRSHSLAPRNDNKGIES